MATARRPTAPLDPTGAAFAVHEDPSRPLEQAERGAILRGALDRLPPFQGRAIRLRWLEGRTNTEIALALGTTPSSVRTQIGRGLARLRALPSIRLLLEDA